MMEFPSVRFHKRGIRSRIVKSVDGIREISVKSESKSVKIRRFRLKITRIWPLFTFFCRFHTPLAQVSNTSFIDRICKIKVKIKKDKVQTKIVGYEKGEKEDVTEKPKF